MIRKPFFLVILILFATFAIYAQGGILTEYSAEAKEIDIDLLTKKTDFWISLGADTAFYSALSPSYGGSFSFGYGAGSSIGIKAVYFFNVENFNLLEVDLLLRFYFFGRNSYSGPFMQFIGGASLINYQGNFAVPANTGIINAGLSFGWRFLFINRFFVEPSVRVGYPYLIGASAGAGVRF